MKKISLNRNWSYVEAALQNPLLVNMLSGWKTTDLPHDYAVEKGRDPKSPAELDEGFFMGAGLYYKKAFVLTEEAAGKQIWIDFDGIAGIAEIWVNKKFIGKHRNPYTAALFDITGAVRSGENEIMLHLDSRMKPNSRWYVGTGLYREVRLWIGEPCAVVPHGVRAVTEKASKEEALLSIEAEVSGKPDEIHYSLYDIGGNLVSENCDGKLCVSDPLLWSPDHPALYSLKVSVRFGEKTDVYEERVGIRTITVDPENGLLLNGKRLKLRGGCIHHDLGLLGAADHKAAELRRIRILKESGFNAVRLAHNPFGSAIFEACDELGMLCVEEAFDEWVLGRTSFGLHITFEDSWERDLCDMIRRDRNHPSIFMWSTGNEVEERDGSADGFAWAKRLAEKVKELDPSRPVSASACALLSEYGSRPASGTTGNQALNMAFDNFASGNDIWGDTTAPYFEPLDVAGYNYKSVRYAFDRVKFPKRVIYGSESYPRAAFQTWKDTEANSNVIGDFVWTAWDYIGEVGVGRYEVTTESRPGNPDWPWMLAYCSDIDLIGKKRPQSYYRDVLWGISPKPHLFCLPPSLTGKNIARLSWGWLPVERNYTFPGEEGKAMEVHVYADADEVELLQNGRSIGRKPCGEAEEYRTVFQVSYLPGDLTAVSYRNGSETGRDCIGTAGPASRLHLLADRPMILGDGRDLAFVTLKAVDENGNAVLNARGDLKVNVQGGKLFALGNADPKPDDLFPFTKDTVKLYQGEALAIIQSTEGMRGCLVEAELEGCEPASLGIGFLPSEEEPQVYVTETKPSAADLPLGELLKDPEAKAVLENAIPALLHNPMLEAMKGMSLKKLLSMGGMSLEESTMKALDQAMAFDTEVPERNLK